MTSLSSRTLPLLCISSGVRYFPLKERSRRGLWHRIDGIQYLEKFYDLKTMLPTIRKDHSRPNHTYVNYLWDTMQLSCGDARQDQLVREGLSEIIDVWNIQVIERIMTHMALTFVFFTSRELKLTSLIVGMVFYGNKIATCLIKPVLIYCHGRKQRYF